MTESDQDVIEVEGQMSQREYVQLVMAMGIALSRVILPMVIVFAAGFVLELLLVPERNVTGVLIALGIALVAAAFMPLVVVWRSRASAAQLHRTHKSFHAPINFQFSNARVNTRSAASRATTDWAAYERVRETEQAFYLHISPRFAHIIPKRFFESEEQMERFRALLRANLPPEVCKV